MVTTIWVTLLGVVILKQQLELECAVMSRRLLSLSEIRFGCADRERIVRSLTAINVGEDRAPAVAHENPLGHPGSVGAKDYHRQACRGKTTVRDTPPVRCRRKSEGMDWPMGPPGEREVWVPPDHKSNLRESSLADVSSGRSLSSDQ